MKWAIWNWLSITKSQQSLWEYRFGEALQRKYDRAPNFHEQAVRIENEDCKEITSEGKDTIIIGSLTENFEQNLTRSDEDLADILVDLG